MSSRYDAVFFRSAKRPAPSSFDMKAPNCSSTYVEPQSPPSGRASSCSRNGSLERLRCIVMSTVPPPQSSTMNWSFTDRKPFVSFSVARHAHSGSMASTRREELGSVIRLWRAPRAMRESSVQRPLRAARYTRCTHPARRAARRMKPLASSDQMAGTVTTHRTCRGIGRRRARELVSGSGSEPT
jgi:hypothetical protein